jgi:hypothetical protein
MSSIEKPIACTSVPSVDSALEKVYAEAAEGHLNPASLNLLKAAYDSSTSPFKYPPASKKIDGATVFQLQDDANVVSHEHPNRSATGQFLGTHLTLGEIGSPNSITFSTADLPGQQPEPVRVHLEANGKDPVDLVFNGGGDLVSYHPTKPASPQEPVFGSNEQATVLSGDYRQNYLDGGRADIAFEMKHLTQENAQLINFGLPPISVRNINVEARRQGLQPLPEKCDRE